MSLLYGFAYTERAVVFLGMLTAKQRGQVKRKIEALASNPRPSGCKIVIGESDGEEQVWRIRSGDYRVLYVVRGTTIVILDIDHRKDVYR